MRGTKALKSNVKNRILEKTDGLCAVCGKTLAYEKVTIEHYIPKYFGGTDDERNLLPLCKACNKRKGSRIVQAEEYYPYLKGIYCSETNEYRSIWESQQ